MTFKEWLSGKEDHYYYRNTHIGDFAYDANQDDTFPDSNDLGELEAYLRSLPGVCPEAHAALKRAHRAWKRGNR